MDCEGERMAALATLDEEQTSHAGAAACIEETKCGTFRVGGAHGQVWLLERMGGIENGHDGMGAGTAWRRRLLGDFDLVSTNPMSVRVCETGDGRVFVFAGVMRRTNHSVKVWYLDKTKTGVGDDAALGFKGGCRPVQLEIATDTKLRGFGDVAFLGVASPLHQNCLDFRIACGLGLGKVHVWRLRADLCFGTIAKTHEGSLSMRSSLSCTALMFAVGGKTLMTAISIDDLVQRWDLEAIAKDEPSKGDTSLYAATPRLGAHVVDHAAFLAAGYSDKQYRYLSELHAGFHVLQARALRKVILARFDQFGFLFPLKFEGSRASSPKAHKCCSATGVPSAAASAIAKESVGNEEVELADCSYEGDLDIWGQPHGYGVQNAHEWSQSSITSSNCSDSPSNMNSEGVNEDLATKITDLFCEYRGQWVGGLRDGRGSLRDLDSGQLVYDGEWAGGVRHGTGKELIPGLQQYCGQFAGGLRHGFGVLDVLAEASISVEKSSLDKQHKAATAAARDGGKRLTKLKRRRRFAGECLEGFFERGVPHGIGRWSFPAGCVALNAERPDDLMHLGRVGCVAVHEREVLLRELLFAREDDGGEIPEDERSILQRGTSRARNDAFELPMAFATNSDSSEVDSHQHACGWWPESGVCWRCLKPGAVLACSGCSLVLHKRCAGNDGNIVACPMPRCVAVKRAMVTLPLQGFEAVKGRNFASLVTVLLKSISLSKKQKENDQSQAKQQHQPLRPLHKQQKESNKRKLAAAAAEASAEAKEVAEACALAKKIAGHKRKSLRFNQEEAAHARLQVHRAQEFLHRKIWRKIEDGLEAQNTSAGQRLAEQQLAQNATSLRLKQLQGLDLNAMRICDLSELQATVEKLIGAALQALESETDWQDNTGGESKHLAAVATMDTS